MRNYILPFLTVIIALVHFAPAAFGQERPPKREFRAVWVATVKGIDYPRQPTIDPQALMEDYRHLLKGYRELGLNAVIFQVRPAGDAFYPSELAPWSAYLTGQQGRPPTGHFDPLAFMIEETHRHGMEFHAWLNPFRATVDLDTFSLSPQHPFYRHRDWMVRYGDKFYFNPALPAVRRYLNRLVDELLTNYDLDAIHFDDYFYPYRVLGEVFPDSLDYRRYGDEYPDIDSWRRSNVDSLIAGVSRTIRARKPHVRFGISPFGVWRNADRDPAGSPTRAGATAYDDLFADVRQWMQRGWIDYVVPQLYWHIGFEVADYAALLDWWSNNSNGRQLYVGHAVYKVANDRYPAWNLPDELPRQVDLNRRNPQSKGSVFFRSDFLFRNALGVKDSLRHRFRYPALIPEAKTQSVHPPAPPEMKRPKRRRGAVTIRWEVNEANLEKRPAYYVIYRFPAESGGDFQDPANILAVTPIGQNCDRLYYVDETVTRKEKYLYVVTAVNRYHVESLPGRSRKVKAR